MRTLEVFIPGQNVCSFHGKTKALALVRLREVLDGLTDDGIVGVELEKDYKETRRIVTPYWLRSQYGDNASPDKPWGVEINENGVGETREFDTRQEAIDFFMEFAAEKGEHWD